MWNDLFLSGKDYMRLCFGGSWDICHIYEKLCQGIHFFEKMAKWASIGNVQFVAICSFWKLIQNICSQAVCGVKFKINVARCIPGVTTYLISWMLLTRSMTPSLFYKVSFSLL